MPSIRLPACCLPSFMTARNSVGLAVAAYHPLLFLKGRHSDSDASFRSINALFFARCPSPPRSVFAGGPLSVCRAGELKLGRHLDQRRSQGKKRGGAVVCNSAISRSLGSRKKDRWMFHFLLAICTTYSEWVLSRRPQNSSRQKILAQKCTLRRRRLRMSTVRSVVILKA